MKMKINDYHLHVEDLGHPKGETVVFLNGVMASTSSWYPLMKYFIKHGYRVILHDFRGQLKSDAIETTYTFEQHAIDTCQILKNLNIRHAHFVGTSYGGEVAMTIGYLFPHIIDSLTVIDSVAQLDLDLTQKIKAWIDYAQKMDGYQFFNQVKHDLYSKAYLESQHDFLEARAQKMKEIPKHYLEGQIKLYETFLKDVDMRRHLKRILAPTLIICGQNDTLKPVKFSQIIHQEIKGSLFVTLPDCGHVAIFEKHAEIETLIIGFVTQHKLKASS